MMITWKSTRGRIWSKMVILAVVVMVLEMGKMMVL